MRAALKHVVKITGKSGERDVAPDESDMKDAEIEALLKFAKLAKSKNFSQIQGFEQASSRNNFTQEILQLMKEIEIEEDEAPKTMLKMDSRLAKAMLGENSPVSNFAAHMDTLEKSNIEEKEEDNSREKVERIKANLNLEHMQKVSAPPAPPASG